MKGEAQVLLPLCFGLFVTVATGPLELQPLPDRKWLGFRLPPADPDPEAPHLLPGWLPATNDLTIAAGGLARGDFTLPWLASQLLHHLCYQFSVLKYLE